MNSDNFLIPQRKANASSGSEFINKIKGLNKIDRADAILNEFMEGNIPDFLRKFKIISIGAISYLVTSDYLSIGDNNDYIRMPMSPLMAQKICDKYDCSLPTKYIVETIHKQAEIKLSPKPWGPPYDHTMDDTNRYLIHNNTINKQLINLDKTKLISGHKKDVVITNKLAPNNSNKKVAIFGWIANGTPIQGLNVHSHDYNYQDYSHGIRLVINDVLLEGRITRIQDVFIDPIHHKLLSDEGIMKFNRY